MGGVSLVGVGGWCRPDTRRDGVPCEWPAHVCGSSVHSFSGTGGLVVSVSLSSLLDAGFASRSPVSAGESWGTRSETPEQLRWVMDLPPESRRRGMELTERQIQGVGACERPIWLSGKSLTFALASGAVVGEYSSIGMPFGAVPVRCMNRRASVCGPCSKLYRGDAYHLARSGMAGGKGVPESVSANPQVFVTLTAPSFGAVHRVCSKTDSKDRCRTRRGAPVCAHGNPLFCAVRHAPGDAAIGTPLCPECYDYAGQVLFNALASRLFKAVMDTLYHRLASLGGVSRSEMRRVLRVEYVKVAEYQARGVVHFHIVMRLDGPGGAGDPPPAWATAELLAQAVKSAAASASVAAPASAAVGEYVARFGAQVDAQPVGSSAEVSDARVAGYLAKYTTKSTEDAGGADRPIRHASQLEGAGWSDHVRALMVMAWQLGALREFEPLNIQYWTHMLGYGGHPVTKSVRYSTTFGALRAVRSAYRAGPVPDAAGEVVVVARWQYRFSGYPSLSLRLYADQMRRQMQEERQDAQWALADLRWQERGGGGDGPW